jgi:PIN domain nuclease of toxin-antitoxin system
VKLLLDTHIWIWEVEGSNKLGRLARRQIESPKNDLFLSPVSIWEAHNLERRRRLRAMPSFPEWLDRVFLQTPLSEAPFNFAVATTASRLELPQPDLGDILLAATALTFDLTLITADAQLLDCAWLKTLPND